jgi:hypothetical protein
MKVWNREYTGLDINNTHGKFTDQLQYK